MCIKINMGSRINIIKLTSMLIDMVKMRKFLLRKRAKLQITEINIILIRRSLIQMINMGRRDNISRIMDNKIGLISSSRLWISLLMWKECNSSWEEVVIR